MASVQANHKVQHTTCYEKTTITEVTWQYNKHHTANNEQHSLTDKMKEMANSARRMFHHDEHHGSHDPSNGHHGPEHMKKPAYNCYPGTAHDDLKTKKKNRTKRTEGHCIPKLHKKEYNGSSDSGSSSGSENETFKKRY